MKRYFQIYRAFFTSAFIRELEYKANFFAKIFQNLLWLGFFIVSLLVVFQNTKSIAGWNRGEAFLLGGTAFLVDTVTKAFFMGLFDLPQQVRQGTLDFVLTRPVDAQFWVSARRFNFDQAGALLAGIVMMVYGAQASGLHPDVGQWINWGLLTGCAIALMYALTLSLMATSIWLVRVDNMFVVTEMAIQLAKYPIEIYTLNVQRALLYAVPIGLLATVPAWSLVRSVSPAFTILGIVWALAGLLLSRSFWKYGLRNYTSASD